MGSCREMWNMPRNCGPFDREMNALKLARDKTGIRDCTIVTWDDEDESDGIRIVPVWKWLLA